MNKILVNSEKKTSIFDNQKYVFQNNETFFLEIDSCDKEIFLIVQDNVKVVLNLLGKNTKLNIHLQMKENASFILNCLLIDGNIDFKADLIGTGANLNFNYSLLNGINSSNKIKIIHKASKTTALLKNHGFSSNHANIIFDVSAYINKEASKCISHQDNQIIQNEKSISQINPNLYIDNYDVDASHSAYVGEFKENELFYLMSRGLTKEMSKFLLLKSFLIGSFDLEEKVKEKYYHEVIKYFNEEV